MSGRASGLKAALGGGWGKSPEQPIALDQAAAGGSIGFSLVFIPRGPAVVALPSTLSAIRGGPNQPMWRTLLKIKVAPLRVGS